MKSYKIKKYSFLKFLNITLIFFVIFLIVSVFNILNYSTEGYRVSNEALDNSEIKDMCNFKDSWCKSTSGAALVKSCSGMLENDCKSISCCIFAKFGDTGRCLAGNQDGPMFLKDKDNYDYYIFKNKCYGDNCPA